MTDVNRTGVAVDLESLLPDLSSVWQQSLGDPSVRIAIIDGPVDLDHPCFSGARIDVGQTLVSSACQGAACRHGTHVASVVFGQHSSPVKGVAPNCSGLILPVFGEDDKGRLLPCTQVDLARAISQALNAGANVINISAGELTQSATAHPILQDAVQQCHDSGVLIVSAAGNDGCDCLHIPGALPTVLVVGAMTREGEPLDFSNWSEAYATHGLLAPGEDILGAFPGRGRTSRRTGTSAATPIVSGVAGLLLSIQRQHGRSDPLAVRESLLATAVDCRVRPTGDCRRLLTGRLDIAGALQQLSKGAEMSAHETPPAEPADSDRHSTSPQTSRGYEHEAEPAEAIAAEVQVSSPEPVAEPAARADTAAASEVETEIAAVQVCERTASPEPAAPAPVAVSHSPEPLTRNPQMTATNEQIPGLVPSDISASACGCQKGGGEAKAPAIVYALGALGFDYGNETNRDTFIQHSNVNPNNTEAVLEHLAESPWDSDAVIWTLNQNATPIYAVQPGGAYAAQTYERLRESLADQINSGAERVSIPGLIVGSVTLMNGQNVPRIVPDIRGIYTWKTGELCAAVLGEPPKDEGGMQEFGARGEALNNFLQRIYYELRNLGVTPQERAMNFGATNAFQANEVFRMSHEDGLMLDSIDVQASAICRPGSDCWDVNLTFFDPQRRQERARKVYRYTIDVSGVLPVTVGEIRAWDIY